MIINYWCADTLCAVINVNFKERCVTVNNLTDDVFYAPFGVNENPSFEDFKDFLEDRCFPRTRHHVKYYLKQLGLDFYDPLDICRKTEGRMHGDTFWLEFVEVDDKTEVLHEE